MPGTQASGFVPGVLTPVRAPQAAPPPLHPPHPSPPSSCPLSTPGLLADSPSWVFLGESFLQLQQRLLRDREAKIQKALERLRCKRRLLGQQRRRKEFPVVSVVGYTNCGEGRVRDWGLGGARGRGPPQGAAGGRGLPGAGLSWWVGPHWGGACGWTRPGARVVGGISLRLHWWAGPPWTVQGCMGLMGGPPGGGPVPVGGASLGRGCAGVVPPCVGGRGLIGVGLVGGPALGPGWWVGSPSGCTGRRGLPRAELGGPVSTFPSHGRHIASAQLHHHASV